MDTLVAPVWWRAEAPARSREAPRADGRVAFAALVAFTVILVLSPQAWFPILKTLRIAFQAGAVAVFAYLLERAVQRRAANPLHPEMAIALALVGWAIVTVPLSIWPGGSVAELSE